MYCGVDVSAKPHGSVTRRLPEKSHIPRALNEAAGHVVEVIVGLVVVVVDDPQTWRPSRLH